MSLPWAPPPPCLTSGLAPGLRLESGPVYGARAGGTMTWPWVSAQSPLTSGGGGLILTASVSDRGRRCRTQPPVRGGTLTSLPGMRPGGGALVMWVMPATAVSALEPVASLQSSNMCPLEWNMSLHGWSIFDFTSTQSILWVWHTKIYWNLLMRSYKGWMSLKEPEGNCSWTLINFLKGLRL